MKKLTVSLLFILVLAPLWAQVPPGGMNIMAKRYETTSPGLYASHSDLPFGTQLIVTNPLNNQQVIVQVGGRLMPGSEFSLELSSEAADSLGITKEILFSEVNIREVPKQVKARAIRPRLGLFKQTGPAARRDEGAEFTALHPSLPIGTKLRVKNENTGRETVVTITGRIRASRDRIIEISRAAAQALGIRGTTEVLIETVDN